MSLYIRTGSLRCQCVNSKPFEDLFEQHVFSEFEVKIISHGVLEVMEQAGVNG